MTTEIFHHIIPLTGLGPLLLGSAQGPVKETLGEPDVVRRIEADGVFEASEIWEFHSAAISLFFTQDPPQLSAIECSHASMLLFGQPVCGLSEKEFIAFMKSQGLKLSERDDLPGGEKCLCFDDAHLDAYFMKGRLELIQIEKP